MINNFQLELFSKYAEVQKRRYTSEFYEVGQIAGKLRYRC